MTTHRASDEDPEWRDPNAEVDELTAKMGSTRCWYCKKRKGCDTVLACERGERCRDRAFVGGVLDGE